MGEQKNSIRVLFTLRANTALDNIIKNFKLEENIEDSIKRTAEGKQSKIATIDRLVKDFAREIMSEKDLIAYLQKDFGVSQQIAEQISKDIISGIIPFLEKAPEEKFEDPALREQISKKLFTTEEELAKEKEATKRMVAKDVLPRLKDTEITGKEIEEENIPVQIPKWNEEKVKSPIKKQIKKPIEFKKPAAGQQKNDDKYREPIE
jgi:hypothetical protein